MLEGTVTWVEGEQFLAVGPSGHGLVLDADRERNSGPGPMELLLLALGACSGSDVVGILRKKRQKLKRLTIQLAGERRSEPPAVWTRIRVHFHAEGEVDAAALDKAIELSRTKYCSVAATLGHTAEIEWTHTVEAG